MERLRNWIARQLRPGSGGDGWKLYPVVDTPESKFDLQYSLDHTRKLRDDIAKKSKEKAERESNAASVADSEGQDAESEQKRSDQFHPPDDVYDDRSDDDELGISRELYMAQKRRH